MNHLVSTSYAQLPFGPHKDLEQDQYQVKMELLFS